MRAAGAPEAVVQKARAQWQAQQDQLPSPQIVVFPENIQAFWVLNATADQWEYPGAFGGRLALPMTEIRACMDMLQVELTAQNTLRVLGMVRAARAVKMEAWERARSASPQARR
jgi:hypothetical protein